MIHLALLILLAQGGARAETGVVSGTLKLPTGEPAPGVRVAATAVPKPGEPMTGLSLLSLGETDKNGSYRLDGIPPGRYYITAGRLEIPTYYPGTIEVREGAVVAIEAGSTISRIDFTLKDESSGRMQTRLSAFGGVPTLAGFNLPVQIRMDSNGKVPVVFGNDVPILRVRQASGFVLEQAFSAVSMQLPLPSATNNGEFKVEVDGLPADYTVKSMQYVGPGSVVDLTKEPLRISIQGLSQAPVQSALAALGIQSGFTSDKTLVVVLSKAATAASPSGIKVTGIGFPSDVPIYLSGVPGIVYSDGSFEFEGVQPGRHTLVRFRPTMTLPHATSIVVGDRDVNNVKLQTANILPQDIEEDKVRPAAAHPPGSVLPFAVIRGRVVREGSEEAATDGGTVSITGYRNGRRLYAIDGEGRFEIRDLVPGSYRIELSAAEVEAPAQNVVIDEGDAEITFRGRPRVIP